MFLRNEKYPHEHVAPDGAKRLAAAHKAINIFLLRRQNWDLLQVRSQESLWSHATATHSTQFINVPIGSIVILISSPDCNVKWSGGTIPVPVNRKQPCGKELSR